MFSMLEPSSYIFCKDSLLDNVCQAKSDAL